MGKPRKTYLRERLEKELAATEKRREQLAKNHVHGTNDDGEQEAREAFAYLLGRGRRPHRRRLFRIDYTDR